MTNLCDNSSHWDCIFIYIFQTFEARTWANQVNITGLGTMTSDMSFTLEKLFLERAEREKTAKWWLLWETKTADISKSTNKDIMTVWLINWVTNSLNGLLINRLTLRKNIWLAKLVFKWLIDSWLMNWRFDWLTDWLTIWIVDWLIYWLSDW